VDNYHDEGPRLARFLDHDVIKYHRTVASYIQGLLDAGFTLSKFSELKPTPEMLEKNPAWQDETRRPMFLLLSAVK